MQESIFGPHMHRSGFFFFIPTGSNWFDPIFFFFLLFALVCNMMLSSLSGYDGLIALLSRQTDRSCLVSSKPFDYIQFHVINYFIFLFILNGKIFTFDILPQNCITGTKGEGGGCKKTYFRVGFKHVRSFLSFPWES